MQITIAGVPRTSDVLLKNFSIEQGFDSQDMCTMVIKSGDKPVQGQSVLVEESGVILFGGIIVAVKNDDRIPNKPFYICECSDYTYQLDRKLVVEVYEQMSASEIVSDIITKYCDGFTMNGVVSGAPTIEYIKLDYLRPSECFKQLAEYVGWLWNVDYLKDVKFFKEYNAYAPTVIDENTKIRNIRHEPDIQGLRNRVYVLGGKMLGNEQDYAHVADGKQRLWVLGHEPHSPWVVLGDASNPPIKPGLEFVDNETQYDWMYNQREKYIRCSEHTPTPTQGTTVIFRYKPPLDVITMVEDLGSQQAIATIQGGDGIYEHKIVDDSLITVEAAEAAGNADLAEHANPKINGSFEIDIVTAKNVQVDAEFVGWQTSLELKDYFDGAIYDENSLYSSIGTAQLFYPTFNLNNKTTIRVQVQSQVVDGNQADTQWHICKDVNGFPGESIGYGTVNGYNWPAAYDWLDVEVDLSEPLQKEQKYWLLIIAVQGDSTAEFLGSYTPDIVSKLDFPVYKPIYERQVVPLEKWEPGQLLTINLSNKGIQGQYVIQKVNIKAQTNNLITYTITYGGKLKGIPDLLRALVSSQQQKKVVDVKYQSKFVVADFPVGLKIEYIITPRTEPWVCGDEDAICGEIVCL